MKYAIKIELLMLKGIAAIIRSIAKNATENGSSTSTVLKRMIGKLLGDRMMSK